MGSGGRNSVFYLGTESDAGLTMENLRAGLSHSLASCIIVGFTGSARDIHSSSLSTTATTASPNAALFFHFFLVFLLCYNYPPPVVVMLYGAGVRVEQFFVRGVRIAASSVCVRRSAVSVTGELA